MPLNFSTQCISFHWFQPNGGGGGYGGGTLVVEQSLNTENDRACVIIPKMHAIMAIKWSAHCKNSISLRGRHIRRTWYCWAHTRTLSLYACTHSSRVAIFCRSRSIIDFGCNTILQLWRCVLVLFLLCRAHLNVPFCLDSCRVSVWRHFVMLCAVVAYVAGSLENVTYVSADSSRILCAWRFMAAGNGRAFMMTCDHSLKFYITSHVLARVCWCACGACRMVNTK